MSVTDHSHSTGSEAMYKVYALRYGARPGEKSKEYLGFAMYGEPDGPAPLDYFFWVARNDDRIVLFDTGYNKDTAARAGRYLQNDPHNDPLDVLALLDIAPEDVDHIVITHMHHDHVGNLHRFPRASFSISREEYAFCTGPLVRKELLARWFDEEAIEYLATLTQEGRLHVIDGPETLFPGVDVSHVGGHSPGQVIAQVATAAGTVVLASDAIHFYEELDTDRPFWVFTDLLEYYRGYQTLRELAAKPATSIVAGHDPEVMRRFATVHPDAIVDLGAPVVATVGASPGGGR